MTPTIEEYIPCTCTWELMACCTSDYKADMILWALQEFDRGVKYRKVEK